MNTRIFFITLIICLLLTSCGGAASGSGNINVTMTDFQFTPNQFTVTAGKEVSFTSSNTGAVAHNFVIMKLGKTVGTEFTADDEPNIYWQVGLFPGDTVETTFTAPSEPGEYEVVCRTPGHLQAGMSGKLTVTAEDTK